MIDQDLENAFSILENETKKRILSIRKDISDSAIQSNTPINQIKRLAEEAKQFEDIAEQLVSFKQILYKPIARKKSLTKEYIEEGRVHKGERTPQIEYRIPILLVLKEMGGSGKTRMVIERIFPIMKNKFNIKDKEFLPSRNEIRWQNVAMWERSTMVQEGLLSDKSPHGVWEITSKGYKYLELNS